MRRILHKAFASSFVRHATLLTSGTVAANLITLLALPVFSRLYGPEQFGLQSLLILGSTVLGALATGYYDWAIPTPKSPARAAGLASLALALAAIVSAAALLVLLCSADALLALLDLRQLRGWAYALPPLAFAIGAYNIGNYWLLRIGNLRGMTQIRFVLPVVNAVVAFALAPHPFGLIAGQMAGMLAAGAVSLTCAHRAGLRFAFRRPLAAYVQQAREYREFPLFGSIPAAAMLLAGQVPLLVITRAYSLDQTGHYAVVRSIVFGAVYIMATAVGQIVLKHVAEAQQRGEAAWPHFLRMALLIGAVGVAGAAALLAMGPFFFRLYLGDGWESAGGIAQYMAFALPFWLLGIALSTAPVALRRLKPVAVWQLGYGAAACGLFLLPGLPFMELVHRVMLFEIAAYALYVLTAAVTVAKARP